MRERLRALAGSGVTRQTSAYALASIASQGLAAISRIALAAVLSVAGFGAFSFSLAFLQYGALFFEFGLFLPAARLAARSRPAEARAQIGAALALYAPVGAAFCLTVLAASFAVDSIFDLDAGAALLLVSPLALVFPFGFIAMQLSQAVERLHAFALTSLLAQALFLAAVLAVWLLPGETSPGMALLLRAAGLLAGAAILILWLKPRFERVLSRWRSFARGAREYGLEVYVGRVLSIGTYNMDVLMLGIFTDARTVGLYALAGSIAAAAGLPVTGFGAALFRRMANRRALRRSWLHLAWLAGGAFALLAWLLAPPFLAAFFPSGYEDAAAYVGPLALAQAIRGVTTVYNSFLSAQGVGRPLRNAALVLTASNLALNFLLIPPYGAAGAAWASVLALLANYAAHVHGYRRYLRDPRRGGTAEVDGAPAEEPAG